MKPLVIWGLIILQCIHNAVADPEHPFIETPPRPKAIDDNKVYWNQVAQAELDDALSVKLNTNVAKNVIIFLGDGMGLPTVTAARIYEGQERGNSGEEGFLSFEHFPHVGLSKTYCVDTTVADSAATGTAYLCGTKTNKGVLGVDGRVPRKHCVNMTEDTHATSIVTLAQQSGKRTGVVTSTRVTHATPGSSYAHIPEREWECDGAIPALSYQNCPFLKDIALQLVEDEPGTNFNVIMGGGFQMLDPNPVETPGDYISTTCRREDNRTLWQEWLDGKAAEGKTAAFVRTKTELADVDLANTEHLMGIFANSHIPFEYQKIELGLDLPTLTEMTEAAITLLSQEPNGYFLLVEGGRIDNAHHDTNARASLDETVEMHRAIERTLQLVDQNDTLIVVTADHSHTMTISGYASRGASILGEAGTGFDLRPYLTLSYANGPGYNFSVEDGKAKRGNLRGVDTTDFEFKQQTLLPLDYETHGGEDVAIYATGPMAHLFHSVHEQNYIAHVMAYASCIDSGDHCSSK